MFEMFCLKGADSPMKIGNGIDLLCHRWIEQVENKEEQTEKTLFEQRVSRRAEAIK